MISNLLPVLFRPKRHDLTGVIICPSTVTLSLIFHSEKGLVSNIS